MEDDGDFERDAPQGRDLLILNQSTNETKRSIECDTNFLGYVLGCTLRMTEVLKNQYVSLDGSIVIDGKAEGYAEQSYDRIYEKEELVELIVEAYKSALQKMAADIQRRRRETVASI